MKLYGLKDLMQLRAGRAEKQSDVNREDGGEEARETL